MSRSDRLSKTRKSASPVTPPDPSPAPVPAELPSLEILRQQFLVAMRMRNCSPRTIELWDHHLSRFQKWCLERELPAITALTCDHLAAYRRSLFHYRNPKTQAPLKFVTQASYLMSVRRWCAWLAKQKWIAADIGRELELPKEEQRLPVEVLTAAEVEHVLEQTDITRRTGLRDRAVLETFYSTGMRCSELIQLQVYDLQAERGVIVIRQGKGRKDRVVPIGARALAWLRRYLTELRPQYVDQTNESTLFVSEHGRAIGRNHMSGLVKRYLRRAGLRRKGSCHLLRHTAATLMLENGADLRSLQMFLGHERLNTTQIYTHVSIQRLQQVHARTHPASSPRAGDPADTPPPTAE